MRKIGQIRSSTESLVSRTRRRAHSALRLRRGRCASVITLNRPQALNALTLTMVREMRRALDAWERDPAVTRVVVAGAGEKAFCAGGDLRRVYQPRMARGPDRAV